MNTNIKKTKRHLTILFSLIVFLSFFILWTTFFTVKYFRVTNFEKSEITNLITLFEQRKLSVDEIISFWNKWEKDFLGGKRKRNDFKIIAEEGLWFKPNWFINYILINNTWSLISSNIKDDIEHDQIISIIKNDSYYKLSSEEWFLIKKNKLNNNEGVLILIRKVWYNLSDYLSDVFWFLFINILFSLILYFIGFKFVNKAFVPVEENMKDMTNFIHNAGHELKTPISVIDSNIQLIDDIKEYDAEMTKELKWEVIRLNSIIDSLIKLSNLWIEKESEKINIKETVDFVLKEFSFKISEKNIKFKVNISDTEFIKVNKDYFYMFVSNLIGNAIKYNLDNGSIDISYSDKELLIKDSGIWIDKKDIGKIFDRFFKSDDSRSTDGFGIGLSLVKKISDIYNWKIHVESEKWNWTSFIVKF